MNKLKFFAVIALSVILFSCKDDKYGVTNYSENEPAQLNMLVNIPAETIVSSRSLDADFESRINQMVIIGFEQTSGRKIFHNLTGLLETVGTPANGQRSYRLTQNVDTKSGIYRLYLIANWQSVYANLTAADIEAMTEEQIQNNLTFTNTGSEIDLFGDYGFPMTQKIESFQIYPNENNRLTGVSLVRATAHIEFKIKNGTGVGSNVPDFQPTGYTVYRLPKTAKGFSDALVLKEGTFNSIPNNINTITDPEFKYGFDFFMLENNQTGATTTGTATDQASREAWNENGAVDFADREFINAPEGATFVVIKGNYNGPAGWDSENNQYTETTYSGQVTYIIHLGNFNTTKGGAWNNFNVNRNEYHTYKITVNGAYSILANVDVNNPERNPGMEGYLNEQPVADLDAHYEKIMMRINKASIISPTDGSRTDSLILSTPVNGFSRMQKAVKDLTNSDDYKWIQFQKPENENEFPLYAGINADGTCANAGSRKWGYITDLVTDLKAYLADNTHSLEYALDNGSEFIVAAFVDENIYTDNTSLAILDWAGEQRNKRVMTLNPSQQHISSDGQSTYNSGSAFSVSQLPVVSLYSLDPANAPAGEYDTYNPFGLEQVMEKSNTNTTTTITSVADIKNPDLYPSALVWDLNAGLSSTSVYAPGNARSMMLDLMDGHTISDEVKSFFKLTSSAASYSTYEFVPTDFTKVSQSIAAHNRDLNGDGIISGDEIRWYIPGLIQYYIFNFGYNQVSDFLWLSQPGENSIALAKGDSPDKLFPRYFTSTRQTQRLFWQDQRGATSAAATWAAPANNIRYVRNLGKFTDSNTHDITRITQHDKENKIIRVINGKICRDFSWTTAYPAHDVTSQYNLLPHAFEYGYALDLFSGASYPSKFTSEGRSNQEIANLVDSLALVSFNNKTGGSNTALPDGWRIPNQRELVAMFVNNVISAYAVENADASSSDKFWAQGDGNYPTYSEETGYIGYLGYIFSCTFINTPLYEVSRPYPIVCVNGDMALPNTIGNNYARMILVRDVDPTTGQPVAVANTISKLRKMGIERHWEK